MLGNEDAASEFTEYSSIPVKVENINDATAITAGDRHTCALHQDGTVSCWGQNWYGQLGSGTLRNLVTPGKSRRNRRCRSHCRRKQPHLRHSRKRHDKLLGQQRSRTARSKPKPPPVSSSHAGRGRQRRLHAGSRLQPYLRPAQRRLHHMLGQQRLRTTRRRAPALAKTHLAAGILLHADLKIRAKSAPQNVPQIILINHARPALTKDRSARTCYTRNNDAKFFRFSPQRVLAGCSEV